MKNLQQYRSNLKREQKNVDRKLAGRVLWGGFDGTARKIYTGEGRFLTNGSKQVKIN